MSPERRLPVVLGWHMHQPEYRDAATGEFAQPWTYLHAIKDYVDMAAHLEANPAARAVVNFAPVLLDQIDAYCAQLDDLAAGGRLADPLLAALAAPAPPRERNARAALVRMALRAHRERMIERYPPFRRLVDIATAALADPERCDFLGDAFVDNLLAWYHLAWLGETVKRSDARVARLLNHPGPYGLAQRRLIVSIIAELLHGLRPRYRALAERGQIEPSMSPYAHPLVPLLLDFECAHESAPDSALPAASGYPGGAQRVRWHLRTGIATFQRWFGAAAGGCWPSEGAVSDATLAMLAEEGFHWAATGAQVLRNSLGRDAPHAHYRHASGISLFARDDALSDRIGFHYSSWHGDDAVADLTRALTAIGAQADADACVVLMLDGENAWEYYPDNAFHFLSALYDRLAVTPRIELTTCAALRERVPARPLPHVVAGSWVHGTLSTWIGAAEKNRAWDLLVAAKAAADAALATASAERRDAIERQLAVCEASDWFWWLGDYNPAAAVGEFERLFRRHLAQLYRLLGQPAPSALNEVLAEGHGAPAAGGTMRASDAPDP
jgi:alpha-amylase/alpha-mannosidase (GH57 family)